MLARAGVVALMAIAAAIGWAAGPDRDEPGERSRGVVAMYRLSGELPASAGDARLHLGSAAALPRIRGGSSRPPAPAARPEPAATPDATPAPTPTPEPAASPEVTVVPVATAPPAAPTPAPTAAPPRPTSTPGPTFDTSG